MIKEVDYDCDEQCFCFIWVLSEVFQEGNYEVEIYNKGYFVGISSFQLRQELLIDRVNYVVVFGYYLGVVFI